MNRTAVIRVTRTVAKDGIAWHSAVLDVGACHLETPLAFRTLGGLMAYLGDALAEELDQNTRTTEPALLPVTVEDA